MFFHFILSSLGERRKQGIYIPVNPSPTLYSIVVISKSLSSSFSTVLILPKLESF